MVKANKLGFKLTVAADGEKSQYKMMDDECRVCLADDWQAKKEF